MLEGPLLPFILIVIGLLLLVVEVFVPSGGLITILSVLALICGVTLVFYNYETTTGMITLVSLFLIVPVIVGIAFHYWPHTRVGKLMMLQGPEPEEIGASLPEDAQRSLLDAGVPIDREARTEPWGLREMHVHDPDGRTLVVVEVPGDHPLRRDTRNDDR